MLDMIKKKAAEFLGIGLRDLRQAREALHAEIATDEGRYAARTQLTHPEGSTTPLNEAADRAQQAFAKTKAALEKELPNTMRLFLEYEVTKQLRDETEKARDRHWDTELARRTSGLHPKVDSFFRRLFMHGATPHNLAQHSDEDVAIIADLHRWKASDALFLDPNNPWRSIYEVYAERQIAVPGGGRTVKRSILGAPVRTKRYAADKWYMFNEIAARIHGVPFVAAAAGAPPKPAPMPTPPSGPNIIQDAAAGATVPIPAVEVAPPSHDMGGQPPTSSNPDEPVAVDAADGETLTAPGVGTDAQGSPTLTPERAREIARSLYYNTMLIIYWPMNGTEKGGFDLSTLIPALEKEIATDKNWIGLEQFLAAARSGQHRQFIDDKLNSGAADLARQLLAGDARQLERARNAGFTE